MSEYDWEDWYWSPKIKLKRREKPIVYDPQITLDAEAGYKLHMAQREMEMDVELAELEKDLQFAEALGDAMSCRFAKNALEKYKRKYRLTLVEWQNKKDLRRLRKSVG
jgi:hypothetical protein